MSTILAFVRSCDGHVSGKNAFNLSAENQLPSAVGNNCPSSPEFKMP